MADLSIPNLERIRAKYPEVHDAIQTLVKGLNQACQQGNLSPVGSTPSPAQHAGVSVKGGAGIVDIAIFDPSDQYRGLHHFADVSTDASFSNYQTISDGPSTSLRRYMGSGKYYVRTYSQYAASAPSPYYNAGMVDATGSVQPEPQMSSTKQGFGQNAFTTVTQPKRA